MDRDRDYSDEDMAEVSDSSEWSAEEFARAKPFAEAFPDLAERLTKGIEIARLSGEARLSVQPSGNVAAYYESFDTRQTGGLIPILAS